MESGGACLKGVNSRALKLAHAADLAKDFPGVQVQGNAMSKARFEFRWHSIRTRPGNGAGLPRRTTPAEAHKGFCSMCGPNFCSMKITQDVRDYAQKLGLDDEAAIAKAMEEKAVEFKQSGVEIYKKA